MKILTGALGVLLLGMATQASAETIRFAIVRNGEQIGTHVVEINRAGPETSVKIATDLDVKVLFVTAYRLQHRATEKWVEGRLVAMSSNTDNNGTRHRVSVSETPAGMEIHADGKSSKADNSLVPGSLWNLELLHRKVMLDAQDGQILPLAVVDHGSQQVTVKSRVVKAHHYTLKSKWVQDVWYDDQDRLVKASLIASDGSEVLYQLL
ncbi:MAG: DUF6134 family protein [Xanthobacteraceae bacterium]|jgi:Domain of unknown function (DUF6134)